MDSKEKCSIEVVGEMTQERYASFIMLYQPLIGTDAAMLYHCFFAIGTRHQKIRNHLLLKKISGQSMELMEKSRRLLEQYLLVKTFYDSFNNSYIYQIFMPMTGNDFLRHEVFGRMYFKKMGKQVYEFNKLCFSEAFEDKQHYRDITVAFENILTENWKDSEEEKFQKSKPDALYHAQNDIPLSFNFDLFLTNYSTTLFPQSCRNEDNLRTIGELATIHGISEMDMRKYVSQSMNLKTNTLNIETLKKKVRRAKRSIEVNMDEKDPYTIPPVLFLKNKQHGIPVTASDSYLIESLITDFKLRPEVVNVLIEYVLDQTNQRFAKNYVEKVASVWVRLNIDTSEKALALIQEEKEKKPKVSKKKDLPEWYHNQDSVEDTTTEVVDDQQLEEMMKRLRGDS